jgi:hypothetical protein
MQINSLFSSVRGKIKILLVAVTNNDGADQYGRILALLHSLSGHTGLLVWCNSQAVAEDFAKWLNDRGIHAERRTLAEPLPAQFRCVLLAPDEAGSLTFYSHWVRDPFLWKPNADGTLTLLESQDAQHEDALWGRLHLRHLHFEGAGAISVKSRAIPVAGGNILFDEDFVMAGAKQLRQSAAFNRQSDFAGDLLRVMNDGDTGQPFQRVVIVGEHTEQEPAKLIHIDLYLSLTGQRDASGCYLVFVGRCVLLSGTSGPDPDLVRSVAQMNDYLDAVEKQLLDAGFGVRRNPVPVLQKRNAKESYLCSYNNCLAEVAEGEQPVVWLACLSRGQETEAWYEDLLRLEQDNIELWRDAGFEVRLVDANFHTILDDQGSLHCMTNEIRRTAT